MREPSGERPPSIPYHVVGAPPPLPDGDRVPCPARPARAPLARRQYAYGVVIALVVLVLLLFGILG